MARRLVTMSGRTLVTQYTRQMAKIASAFCPSGGSPAGGSITRRTRNAASPTSRTGGRRWWPTPGVFLQLGRVERLAHVPDAQTTAEAGEAASGQRAESKARQVLHRHGEP